MAQSINEIQDEVIEEFEFFTDWMEKYEHIIGFGKALDNKLPEGLKTDENLVKGCQSRVWMHAELDGDNMVLMADSDAVITKGMAALMLRILSGHKPDEIAKADLYFVDKIGLKEHLSPNRANGLASMIKKIKMYALAFDAKLKTQ
ncbi:MAG: SufE family protein [Salibacteraceae bacterium]